MNFSRPLTTVSVNGAKELMRVALGEAKADLVIKNVRILNVYTGEFLDRCAIAVKGEKIAYVGDHTNHMLGPETIVIDAEGKTAIPGLIDGHTHMSAVFGVSDFISYAVKSGTTTVITETMEPFPVMGLEGVEELMVSFENQPVKFFGTAPAMLSTSRSITGIPPDALKKLLQRDDIVGLGESYWQAVLQQPDLMIPLFNETLQAGKTLEGHSAGARGNKLSAYVAAGISSCHEPITAAEAIERLRLGLYVMIREGSVRRDLEAIAQMRSTGIDFRRAILVTDGIDPEDIIEKGYMDYVVQKAIHCGFDPVCAVRMATLHVAEHFHLDGLIGGIAPGKYADIVLIPDPETIEAQCVISSGKLVLRNREFLFSPRSHPYPEKCRRTVRLSGLLQPGDFKIPVTDGAGTRSVRLISLITDLVTKEDILSLPVEKGEIRTDVDQDVLKIAAVDRTHTPGKLFTAFVRGFGLKFGAMASSAAWDTSDILVVGTDDADMALAVNRIWEMQGGAVVCAKGKIMAEFPLPVFGFMSDEPMPVLYEKTRRIKEAAIQLGTSLANPLLTLNTMSGAAIPYIRICEEGLVNLKSGRTIGLFADR